MDTSHFDFIFCDRIFSYKLTRDFFDGCFFLCVLKKFVGIKVLHSPAMTVLISISDSDHGGNWSLYMEDFCFVTHTTFNSLSQFRVGFIKINLNQFFLSLWTRWFPLFGSLKYADKYCNNTRLKLHEAMYLHSTY